MNTEVMCVILAGKTDCSTARNHLAAPCVAIVSVTFPEGSVAGVEEDLTQAVAAYPLSPSRD